MASAALGAAGTSENPWVVPRATSQVTVDGSLDEPAWDDALALELEYEVRPGDNVPPPVRTVVLVTYDKERVLVAFQAFDPEPEKIRARFRDRDQAWEDDWVGVVFDTFNDERRAYEFMSNPLGVQIDAVNDDVGGDYDRAWDAIWESAGRITSEGFHVEMGIPFNQIRFQAGSGPQVWGLDAVRSYPRSQRHHIGLFPRQRGANTYLGQERKIIGFEGASPGRNLELVPTLTASISEARPDAPDSLALEEDRSIELGVTGTWGVTPNATLTGAINPDFSQVEADAVQLDLNRRFAIFFPEKRPFFLESGDYFDTGLDLLYTRTIADPSMALKVTGKLGNHTFGVFSARDDVTNVVVPGAQGSSSGSFDESNFSTVARYRYNVGTGSTVGAMVTDREGENGYFNRVVSADAVVRPSEADKLTVDLAWSSTAYSPLMQDELDVGSQAVSGHAAEIEYVHSERSWFAFAEYVDRGDGFRADLGFIPRVGFREANAGGGLLWWGEAGDLYNQLEVGGIGAQTDDQDGELLERFGSLWVIARGARESRVQLELISRDLVYEGVRFDNLLIPFFFGTVRPSAGLSLALRAVGGDWVDFDNVQPADRLELEGELNLDFGRHLQLDLLYNYSSLDVEGGRLFTAHVPELKAVWQFNTRAFARAIVQYTDINRDPALYVEDVDAIDRDLFLQLLLSYKVNPRTVFFLGYSETGAETEDLPPTAINRTVFLKLGYAFRW
jgi:hypothetical protein